MCVMVCAASLVACGGSTDNGAATTSTPPTTTAAASPPALVAATDLATQTDTAYSLDWSVDGKLLAVASGVEVTVLPQDLGDPLAVLKPAKGAVAAALSPDQANLATVGGLRDSTIEIQHWDSAAAPASTAQQLSAGSDQFAVSWSPDGTRLATLADDRRSTIQIWDTSTRTMVDEYDLPYSNPRRILSWSADARTIYDAGELNGHVVYFSMSATDGSVQELGELPIDAASALAFSPDFQRIAAADERGKLQIRSTATGDLLAEFQSVNVPADLAWNPSDSTLAVLSYETTLQVWSIPL